MTSYSQHHNSYGSYDSGRLGVSDDGDVNGGVGWEVVSSPQKIGTQQQDQQEQQQQDLHRVARPLFGEVFANNRSSQTSPADNPTLKSNSYYNSHDNHGHEGDNDPEVDDEAHHGTGTATLLDLCPGDKRRVAKLITELTNLNRRYQDMVADRARIHEERNALAARQIQQEEEIVELKRLVGEQQASLHLLKQRLQQQVPHQPGYDVTTASHNGNSIGHNNHHISHSLPLPDTSAGRAQISPRQGGRTVSQQHELKLGYLYQDYDSTALSSPSSKHHTHLQHPPSSHHRHVEVGNTPASHSPLRTPHHHNHNHNGDGDDGVGLGFASFGVVQQHADQNNIPVQEHRSVDDDDQQQQQQQQQSYRQDSGDSRGRRRTQVANLFQLIEHADAWFE